MHKQLVTEIVESCRKRVLEGDHPSSKLYSANLLEDAIVELAKPTLFPFEPQLHSVSEEACGCEYAIYKLQLTDCGGEFEEAPPQLKVIWESTYNENKK